MFIIDFDNTLFNTTTDKNNFREVRVRELGKLDISEELYQKTYGLARNEKMVERAMYNDERHAEVLSQYGFDKQKVLQVLKSTMSEKLKTFLFPDTLDFLEVLKKKGLPLILFSLGDPEFQYLKLKGCGIEHYFDRVFMTSDPKKDVMNELLKNVHEQEVWFINDKVEETVEICDTFPQIKAILKISTNSTMQEYVDSSLPFFKTLAEINKYIEEYE